MDLSGDEDDGPDVGTNTPHRSVPTRAPRQTPAQGATDPYQPTLYGDVPWLGPDQPVHSGPGGFSGQLFMGTRTDIPQPQAFPSSNGGYRIGHSMWERSEEGDRNWERYGKYFTPEHMQQPLPNNSGGTKPASKCPISGTPKWRMEKEIRVVIPRHHGPGLHTIPEGKEQRSVRHSEVSEEARKQCAADDAANGIPPPRPKRNLRAARTPMIDWKPVKGYVDGKRQLPDMTWIDNFIIPKHILDEDAYDYVARIPGRKIPAAMYARVNAERTAQGLATIAEPRSESAEGRWRGESDGRPFGPSLSRPEGRSGPLRARLPLPGVGYGRPQGGVYGNNDGYAGSRRSGPAGLRMPLPDIGQRPPPGPGWANNNGDYGGSGSQGFQDLFQGHGQYGGHRRYR